MQLVNMVSHRFSDNHYGMPTPSWPYAPYYSPYGLQPPPGSEPQSLQPGVNDYMQKLQQYHAALQEAHYRLMSQQSGPPASVEEREPGVGPGPPFSSRSVNLPPPPPPPAGLFGVSPPTFNFAPRGFPFQPSVGNASHSNNKGTRNNPSHSLVSLLVCNLQFAIRSSACLKCWENNCGLHTMCIT